MDPTDEREAEGTFARDFELVVVMSSKIKVIG
jgi:hypothetical protein